KPSSSVRVPPCKYSGKAGGDVVLLTAHVGLLVRGGLRRSTAKASGQSTTTADDTGTGFEMTGAKWSVQHGKYFLFPSLLSSCYTLFLSSRLQTDRLTPPSRRYPSFRPRRPSTPSPSQPSASPTPPVSSQTPPPPLSSTAAHRASWA